ncbi:MAG TPA: thiamine pyrophosphate-dependent enzyme, partial [Xanthobacteraceae bacterium]
SEQRRPWIDWIHTTRDQGALVRSFVKWDDLPSSPAALVEAMCRANMLTRTVPSAPVYVCLDAGLQESKLEKAPEWPDLARYAPPAPPRPARDAVARTAALLRDAERPLLLVGRGARTAEAWAARVALTERLGACVMTDLKSPAAFPTDHPAHVVAPFNVLGQAAREIIGAADAILALDWVDLGGALRQARTVGPVTARIASATLDHTLHNGFNMDYQSLPTVDVAIAAGADELVTELIGALGTGAKAPWRERIARKPPAVTDDAVTLDHVVSSLKAAFNDPERVSFASLGRGWPIDSWPFRDPLAYLGKDGGGGIGSGPGLVVGAALALHTRGRHTVAMLGDGDFTMGASALWTAVRHRIPLLILINNNRSYFNDELHQETVAKRRGRNPKNRWIGQRLADPEPDLAKLAQAQGALGIGPVRSAKDVANAVERGVAALKQGGVAVIDFQIDAHRVERTVGHRPTG